MNKPKKQTNQGLLILIDNEGIVASIRGEQIEAITVEPCDNSNIYRDFSVTSKTKRKYALKKILRTSKLNETVSQVTDWLEAGCSRSLEVKL